MTKKRPSGGRKHMYPKHTELSALANGYRPKRPPVEEPGTLVPQGHSAISLLGSVTWMSRRGGR